MRNKILIEVPIDKDPITDFLFYMSKMEFDFIERGFTETILSQLSLLQDDEVMSKITTQSQYDEHLMDYIDNIDYYYVAESIYNIYIHEDLVEEYYHHHELFRLAVEDFLIDDDDYGDEFQYINIMAGVMYCFIAMGITSLYNAYFDYIQFLLSRVGSNISYDTPPDGVFDNGDHYIITLIIFSEESDS